MSAAPSLLLDTFQLQVNCLNVHEFLYCSVAQSVSLSNAAAVMLLFHFDSYSYVICFFLQSVSIFPQSSFLFLKQYCCSSSCEAFYLLWLISHRWIPFCLTQVHSISDELLQLQDKLSLLLVMSTSGIPLTWLMWSQLILFATTNSSYWLSVSTCLLVLNRGSTDTCPCDRTSTTVHNSVSTTSLSWHDVDHINLSVSKSITLYKSCIAMNYHTNWSVMWEIVNRIL